MAEIVNLRTARKRAARDKAERLAAESRLVHGVPKAERSHLEGESKRQRELLDQHRIETGDHR
jgi:hypothetical protein